MRKREKAQAMLSGTASWGKGEGGLAGAGDALPVGEDLGPHPRAWEASAPAARCKSNSREGEWSKSSAT